MYDIAVIGAGVVGLSTAVNIQEVLPGRHVTVIADRFTTGTTSHGAAGIIRPTLEKTPVKDVDQFRKWSDDSFGWFHHLNVDLDPSQTGVQRLTGYQFNTDAESNTKYPFHHVIDYDFCELSDEELNRLPGNYRHGWRYTTLMVECRRYLPWLTNKFLQNGGRIEKRTVSNIAEFAGKCSLLVNCAGMAAKTLFQDTEMFPVRGHLIRVKAPWLKHFYAWDHGNNYIYPGQDSVVLGGTRQKGEEDVSEGEPWFTNILDACSKLVPGLKNAPIESKWIGLRPHRTYVRVENEVIYFGGKALNVVHNYGHGANGIFLSWGTAIEAAAITKDLATKGTLTKAKL
ncbi:D-aspartate oxidase-like [Mya arenaria]|uniref:D-aspartate oxidase-like n=1 Tax=Mya arenaria TaxID=6604 RepID=UPI0022E078C0|nr:D-aspartate oxidase-like [Mya arenaria]XP_052817165.1 D-aspartate oxidase-like [Mya arenaria]XP_052817166.1 D-aspartate oxidase-like [Mya arenaria]XP_052817167.1 D-aspartate oxidase-like [Mya arenaria]XP_052817168.1 D-aspartate oxidase-like [Mya arenaria]